MKVRLLYILFFFFVFSPFGKCQTSSYTDGETLKYNIYFKTGFFWFSVGEANFKTTIVDDKVYLEAYAFSYPKWKRFFSLDMKINSSVDKQTLYPETFVRKSIQNKEFVYDSLVIDQEALTFEEYTGTSRANAKKFEYPIKDKSYDLITSFYNIRYAFGEDAMQEDYDFRLLYHKTVYLVTAKFKREELVDLGELGEPNCQKIEIQTVEGRNFDKGTYINIWLSNDDEVVPYAFEIPFKIGKIRLNLEQIIPSS